MRTGAGLEPLAVNVHLSDFGAVRLHLRQKPTGTSIVEFHLATSLELCCPYIIKNLNQLH
jgi:hypothetical protein